MVVVCVVDLIRGYFCNVVYDLDKAFIVQCSIIDTCTAIRIPLADLLKYSNKSLKINLRLYLIFSA